MSYRSMFQDVRDAMDFIHDTVTFTQHEHWGVPPPPTPTPPLVHTKGHMSHSLLCMQGILKDQTIKNIDKYIVQDVSGEIKKIQ